MGTGTSQGVPMIGCACIVCQSADSKDQRLRSSVLIQTKNTNFVIDCGPDFRQQMLREKVEKIDHILFTHEHKDHLGGIDDTRAFNYLLNKPMKLWGTQQVLQAIKQEYHYAFSEYKYPGVPQLDVHEIGSLEPFFIDDIRIIPIQVYHHKMPVLGFRVYDFTYITDANYISDSEKEKIKGSKILVLNALRREKHISHFTLEEAIALAQECNAEHTYFTHISHQLGLYQDLEKELPKGISLAYDGLSIEL